MNHIFDRFDAKYHIKDICETCGDKTSVSPKKSDELRMCMNVMGFQSLILGT